MWESWGWEEFDENGGQDRTKQNRHEWNTEIETKKQRNAETKNIRKSRQSERNNRTNYESEIAGRQDVRHVYEDVQTAREYARKRNTGSQVKRISTFKTSN